MPLSKIDSDSLNSGVPTRAQLPAGSVLQVVQAINTTQYDGTSGAEAALFNFSITPTSASSKVLIFVSLSAGVIGTFGNYALSLRLRRGTTTAGTLLDFCRFGQYAAGTQINRELYGSVFFCGLDTPSTASAQSYCVTVQNIDGGASYQFNSNGAQSNMVLMEIAA